jgi:hypothetical protein
MMPRIDMLQGHLAAITTNVSGLNAMVQSVFVVANDRIVQ